MSLLNWFQFNGDEKDYGVSCTSLTTTGNMTYNIGGKIGKSLECSTSGPTIYMDNPFIGFNTWSIAFWVQNNGASSGSSIFGFNGSGFSLDVTNSSSLSFTAGNQSISSSPLSGGTISPFFPGIWYHFVMTYDYGKTSVYWNGSLVKTETGRSPFTTGADRLCIGCKNTSGSGKTNILLNDFKCYDEVLSLNDIHELYKCKIIHYDFDQASNRNYVFDPNFEGYPESQSDGSGVTATRSGNELTFTGTKLGTPGVIFYRDGANTFHIYNFTSNKVGKKILLSIEYRINSKLTAGTTNPWLKFELDGGNQWPQIALDTNSEIGVWKVATSVRTIANGLTSAGVNIGMKDYTGSITFRNPKIEIFDSPDTTVENNNTRRTPYNAHRSGVCRDQSSKNLLALYGASFLPGVATTPSDAPWATYTANFDGGYKNLPKFEIKFTGNGTIDPFIVDIGSAYLKANTTYTFSGWVYCSSAKSGMNNNILCLHSDHFDEANTYYGDYISSGVTSFNPSWTYFHKTFTTSSIQNCLWAVRFLFRQREIISGDVYWFSGLQIEEGSSPTPYCNPFMPAVPDSSGYGNEGSLLSSDISGCWANLCSASISDPGKTPIGKQYAMIGTDENKSANKFGYLYGTLKNPILTLDITINMWAKFIQSGHQNSGFFCADNTQYNVGADYINGINSYDGNIHFHTGGGTDIAVSIPYSNFTGDNKWHMLTAQRIAGRGAYFYIDGQLISSTANTNYDFLNSFRYFVIGNSCAGGVDRTCKMEIADFEIYLSALTNDDIHSMYTAMAYIDKKYKLVAHSFAERGNPNITGNMSDYGILTLGKPGSNGIFNVKNLEERVWNFNSQFISANNIRYDVYRTGSSATINGSSMTAIGQIWFIGMKYFPIEYTGKYYVKFKISYPAGMHIYLGLEQFKEKFEGMNDGNDGCKYFFNSTDVNNNAAQTDKEFTAVWEPSYKDAKYARLRILTDWGSTTNGTFKISKLEISHGSEDGVAHFHTYNDGKISVERIEEI